MTRQLVWWCGAAWELATRCRPRLHWRAWQMWRRWLINARDVAVLLLAIVGWAGVVWALAL